MKGTLRNEKKKILATIYIHVIGQILNHNDFFSGFILNFLCLLALISIHELELGGKEKNFTWI